MTPFNKFIIAVTIAATYGAFAIVVMANSASYLLDVVMLVGAGVMMVVINRFYE
jgi:hypothetical protein